MQVHQPADPSEFLIFVLNKLLFNIDCIGYCSVVKLGFILPANHNERQYITEKTDYNTHDNTQYTKETPKECHKILIVQFLNRKTHVSIQNLIKNTQIEETVQQVTVATNEYDNPPPLIQDRKPVCLNVTNKRIYTNCYKWIIIKIDRGNYNSKHEEPIQNVMDDIFLDEKHYELVGSVQNVNRKTHYVYHKKKKDNNWVTFDDSSITRTNLRSIAKGYVLLYVQKHNESPSGPGTNPLCVSSG